MEERNILSREEVDALIKSAQSTGALDGPDENLDTNSSNINTNALNNIIEQTCSHIETKLTALLRKKIIAKSKPAVQMNGEEFAKIANENYIYSLYKVAPYNSSVLVSFENRFLNTMLNLLYGGTIEQSADLNGNIGKVGIVTSEKIGKMILEGFMQSSKEYGEMSVEHYKTSQSLQSVTRTNEEEPIYSIEMSFLFDEHELTVRMNLTDELLIKLIPFKAGKAKHKEKDFWRSAIKSEVMDSYVTVTTNMADFKIKLQEFLSMKEGDEIEISDPTLVYVCLNDLKLYRALAGQSNSKLVVKIVSQV